MINRNEIEPIIEKCGEKNQIAKAAEELSELQTILLQDANKGNKSDLEVSEEIADVYVMLRQVQVIYCISDEKVRAIATRKINRTMRRIENE